MEKIKRKKILLFIYWLIIFYLLIYSRFVNLNWSLPYPMHPDERNMAVAIQGLNCEISNVKLQILNLKNCFNPHFFAYGQLPLYLGYLIILIYKVLLGKIDEAINFEEAVMSLRLISALASILNFAVIIGIIKFLNKDKKPQLLNYLITTLLIIFSPFFIQFSHFGTTESLLMLFYSLIVYLSIRLLDWFENTSEPFKFSKFLFLLSVVSGLALATKISSLVFFLLPFLIMFYKTLSTSKFPITKKLIWVFFLTGKFILLSLLFAVLFSPHNIISFNEFISSIKYESDIALGRYLAFYTRQFTGSVPVIFQLKRIFPYALGWPIFLLALLGFLALSWKDKKINLLRLAFLIYFMFNAFLFVKWTRFMAPVFPLMVVFAILFLQKIKVDKAFKIIIAVLAILPGLAYLSVYQNPDVRFTASEWIYKNIPENAYILSETANVVDIPLRLESYKVDKVYKVIPFNFYDLDENFQLQEELKNHLKNADYIFIPSRRIFTNHTCIFKSQKSYIKYIDQISKIFNDKRCQLLKQKYPLLNKYYEDLFNGRLGFKKVGEFSSYPKFKFQILNFKFKLEFPDEEAEETWSVFDHPVVRIYKRNSKFKI